MIFEPLDVSTAFLIRPEPVVDERGSFVRTFCSETFASHGLSNDIRQCSTSFNARKRTLRGLHYQASPHTEAKLVRCTQGAAHHVIVDLRKSSASYLACAGLELNSENRHMLYVPEGVAHGFITLEDNTEIFYQISENYAPDSARGVRWDDPAFDISWPAQPAIISDRDAAFPDYREQD
jgi:dTDP-4-dehydrorhamnose 3,5-epimerase